jgi:predicted  nucleic acid-binding Zn-ribbon protein
MSLTEKIQNDLETYQKAIVEKRERLQQLRNAIAQAEAEINLYNGAIQQCERLLKDEDGAADGDAKPDAE